ncbi:MAG TPA: hypothetical protein VFD43_12205, partial [Planctomycetota bacterium]|nr:hypothetical protein [Planctomycetota bacterium]
MGRLALLALAALASQVAPVTIAAQVQEAVFEDDETPIGTNRIGWAVDLSGDCAIASSAGQHDGLTGYLYAYRRTGSSWTEEQVFKGATTDEGDWFGMDVAIDGDVVVGGAPGVSDGEAGMPGFHRGAAWVFRHLGGWVEEARLQPESVLEHDRFGAAVAVSGDVIVVGAPGVDGWTEEAGQMEESGAAYVFRRVAGTWVEEVRLTAWDGGPHQHFGSAVAASGDTIAIGAEGNLEAEGFSGAVYVYRFDGTAWNVEQRIAAASGARDDRFGAALDLEGEVLAVGAPREQAAGQPKAGRVHVLRRSGAVWSEEAVLQAPAPRVTDNFGYSVSLGLDQLLVGVPGDDTLGGQSGSAAHFRRSAGV